MPMCTAIGWPVPCLQRVLFAVDRVLQVLFAPVCRIAMPKRIKSAFKLKSEKESRNVLTHLQCHDSLVLTFRDASCLDSSLRLITLVCIRRWSYWETFYQSEYCDSQLFLSLTSHVKEAHISQGSFFFIINIIGNYPNLWAHLEPIWDSFSVLDKCSELKVLENMFFWISQKYRLKRKLPE